MRLMQIQFLEEYRTDEQEVVSEFYIPALNAATLYRRAVGYFTSNSIHLAMQGIVGLIRNNGSMRLIVSPYLTEKDIEAIKSGYRSREDIVAESIENQIPKMDDATPSSDQWQCLAWMIANRTLDIKVAIPAKDELAGLYHEKLGIFSDSECAVAFSGSANETIGGLLENFEAIDVFTSWRDRSRTERKIANFERLWNNETHRIEIIPFPDACRAKILLHLPSRAPTFGSEHAVERAAGRFCIPEAKLLRTYQEEAVRNWILNKGRGILQMATGSGKTVTGLAAAQRLFSSGNLQALIVICPYTHLVTQWADECRSFNLEPILCFGSSEEWLELLNRSLASQNESVVRPLAVIATVATFSGPRFQSRLKHFPRRTMILADEVHNMGATAIRASLPESIPFRLGLSATPERWFDDEGTQALYGYFGPVLKPIFTLKDALDQGALCQYCYYPIPVALSDDEAKEYRAISAQIARLGVDSDEQSGGGADALLIKRARLIATANGKESALVALMEQRLGFSHHLFYCGDGTVENSNGEMVKHVDRVIELLSRQLDARVAKFTAENGMDERSDLLRSFASGDLQGLVAIRCLDEGVDVPSTQTAVILASSTNPRQFIQRRGRILRQSPGKKRAEIFDMIVYPPYSDEATPSERSLARKELLRYTEFANLAQNAPEAKKVLWKLQEHFHLTDM